ncbi:mucin-5AC [Scleropages formosus]|uniref:Mucin-5AC-like n=1 Tax=Scleropages formosus TaxID=113540 RepID=A0A8C9UYM1_SCLFO|nr:mucin-5AC-like [Scleropages formosus]
MMGRKVSLLLHGLAFLVGCSHLTGHDRYALASSDPESETPKPMTDRTEQFNTSFITTMGTPSSEAPRKYNDSASGNPPTVPKETALTSEQPFQKRNDSISVTPTENAPQPTTLSNSTTAGPAATDISDFNRTSPLTNESTAGGLTQTPGNQVNFSSTTLNTTSSSSASTQRPDNGLFTTRMPHATLHPSTVPETTMTHSLQMSSLSTQAKVNENSPSQLNVGEKDQDLRRSGPLLAGLVSVFVLAAAVISLLLFLKFRQRSSRPEFRRLQDLPMDDMMEDTPLSMYSY